MNGDLTLKAAGAVVVNQQTCGSCKFWYSPDKVCRRNPPTPIAIPTPKGVMQQSLFPMMLENGWCGEWRTRLSI